MELRSGYLWAGKWRSKKEREWINARGVSKRKTVTSYYRRVRGESLRGCSCIACWAGILKWWNRILTLAAVTGSRRTFATNKWHTSIRVWIYVCAWMTRTKVQIASLRNRGRQSTKSDFFFFFRTFIHVSFFFQHYTNHRVAPFCPFDSLLNRLNLESRH